jgi:hypothetical protein
MPIHHCTTDRCGKSWTSPDGVLPLCITYDCPLRALRDQQPRRVVRKDQFETSQNKNKRARTSLCLSEPDINGSLTSLRSSCTTSFAPYDMEGAKSATTTVHLRDGTKKVFKTTDQMHSEMCAIDWMISEGHWVVFLGTVIWASDYSKVTSAQFVTTEPHCGFCTVFLIAAGLPLGRPTCGNHQLASRLNYQLPFALMTCPFFMSKVLGAGHYHSFPEIKQILNAFYNEDPDTWLLEIGWGIMFNDKGFAFETGGRAVVKWSDLVNYKNAEILFRVWVVVYEQILKTNKEQNKTK